MNVKEVTVSIMGKQYRIACPPGQEQALQQAAATVHARMREISNQFSGENRNASIDRIAVFAALNLAHDLQKSEQSSSAELNEHLATELAALSDRIEAALTQSA